jgi:hypothetical protein
MKKKGWAAIVYVLLCAVACGTSSTYEIIFSKFENIDKPVSFASELSLKGNTYKGCFSSDYSKFYFFRHKTQNAEDYRIFRSSFFDGKWNEPQEIDFSNGNSDLYPLISTLDEDKLYFASYRRIPTDTSEKSNANFWVSSKVDTVWSKPIPFLQADLIYNYNSQPCITKNGSIYFTSDTPDWRNTLTYKMEYKDGAYQKPALFYPVNQFRKADSTRSIFEVCVAPDESYMILTISENHKDAKLFISQNEASFWTEPRYLGDIIKSDMTGNFPYITPNGRFLIFTRDFSGFLILPTATFLEPSK